MPRAREILCYLVIVAITAYILLRPLFGQPRASLLAPATQPSDLAQPNPMLVLQGRHIVGTSILLRMTGNPDRKDLADALEQSATTPVEKAAALLLKREVGDRAQAEKDLTALADQDPALRPDIETALHPDAATSPARIALVEHFGWFGELALSRDLPEDAPARRDILAAATRTTAALLTAMLIGIGGALIGLVLLILFFVFVAQKKILPRLPVQPDVPQTSLPYLEGFALYMLIYFLAPEGIRRLTHNPWFLYPIYLIAPGAAFLWVRFRGQSWKNIRAAAGLHPGQGGAFFREIFAGVVGYITGLPALALAYGVSLLLIAVSHSHPSHPIDNEISTDPQTLLKLFLLASVYAPLVEESLFRGFFYIHMRARLRPIAGAASVALIFAAMHPQGWSFIPVLATLGFTFAMIREYRGSAIANMTAHALQNTFTLILLTVALS